MLSTGLPFKAPQQAHQLAQCDHLRLSLKPLVSEKCKLISPNHCRRRRISTKKEKSPPQIEAKWCKTRSPKSLDFTALSRWGRYAVLLSRVGWSLYKQSTFLSMYAKALYLAIYKHICCSPTSNACQPCHVACWHMYSQLMEEWQENMIAKY